ncbi:MAG: magnesium/cobalt transporter CorA [Candidatus Kapabacteria bacterium]|nr:magnesium/cobalt transporter CorA [Candidatus Kapabacteria bacterium]
MKKKSYGLPPESIVFIGEKKTEKTIINVFEINSESHKEYSLESIDQLKIKKDDTHYWVEIIGLHDTSVLEKIGERFKIHPLILADIANTEHYPKLDITDGFNFIELKLIDYSLTENSITSEQVAFLIGEKILFTFLERETDIFNFVKDRIRGKHTKLTNYSVEFISYSLIDSIVDKYYYILGEIGEKIEELEDEMLKGPEPKTMDIIHNLKRNIIFIRKAVWPLREIIRKLEMDVRNDTNPLGIYYKDLYDHIIQVIDTIETQRELVAEMMDIYLSSVSFKLNDIIKVLTIISTIFIPLTFISSIYGMNFHFMPELTWKWGYPLIMFIMFSIGLSMLIYFKRKKWF